MGKLVPRLGRSRSTYRPSVTPKLHGPGRAPKKVTALIGPSCRSARRGECKDSLGVRVKLETEETSESSRVLPQGLNGLNAHTRSIVVNASSVESPPTRSSVHSASGPVRDHQYLNRCGERGSPTRPRSSPLWTHRLRPTALLARPCT